MKSSGHIIKKLCLKPGTTEEMVTKISNTLERQGLFLANGKNDDGSYYIVARFDDDMHLLAFQVDLCQDEGVKK